MDRVKAARMGIAVKQNVVDTTPQDREVIDAAKTFLDSKGWRMARDRLREMYIQALRSCPINDDMQRYRLAEGLNILDMVEKHLKKVHSDADFNLQQVKKDTASKRGFLNF